MSLLWQGDEAAWAKQLQCQVAELRAELHTARGKLAEQEEQLADHGSQTGQLQAQVESLQGRFEGIESEQARTEDRLFEAGCREDKLSEDVRMLCCKISIS